MRFRGDTVLLQQSFDILSRFDPHDEPAEVRSRLSVEFSFRTELGNSSKFSSLFKWTKCPSLL